MMMLRLAAVAALPLVVLTAACDGGGDGGRKHVLNETLCQTTRQLRLDINKNNEIVLDNSKPGAEQLGLTFEIRDAPVVVVGEIPEGSTIGDPFSTITIRAPLGEKASVTVKPTNFGQYSANCGILNRGQSIRAEFPVVIE